MIYVTSLKVVLEVLLDVLEMLLEVLEVSWGSWAWGGTSGAPYKEALIMRCSL